MAKLMIIYVFLVLGLATCVHGACYISTILTSTDASGNEFQYCYAPEINANMSVGEHIKSYEKCYDFHCSESGLSACGFGYAAGPISIPGCKVLEKDCEPQFVQDPDSEYICPVDIDGNALTTPTRLTPPPPTASTHPPPSLPSICLDHSIDKEVWDLMCSTGTTPMAARAAQAGISLLGLFIYKLII